MEAITLGALTGPQLGKYGPIRVWGSIGFIAVVLGGGAWLDRQPISTLPWALAFFMLATLVAALALPRGRVHAGAQPESLRMTPAIVALLGAGFCNAVAHGALYAFLSLHLTQRRATAARPSACCGPWASPPRSWCSFTCRISFAAMRSRHCWWQAWAVECCVLPSSVGRQGTSG